MYNVCGMFKRFLVLISIIIVSCTKTIAPEIGRDIHSTGFNTKSIKFVEVYRDTSKLYIQSTYKRQYIYFVGDISRIKLKNRIDDRVFVNRIIKLAPYKQKDNKKNFKNLENNKNFQKINIIRYGEWSEIILPIMEKTILDIVPKEKDHAIVISIANKDMAFFYHKGMITTKKIEQLDESVKIDRVYSEREFYNMLAKEVKKLPKVKDEIVNNLIIFEIKGTGEINSPYVLFDTAKDELYYFDFSRMFKVKKRASNSDYYLQILLNTIMKAHIIEPLKNPVTTIQKGSTFTYQNVKKTLESKTIRELEEIPPLNQSNEMMDIVEFESKLDKIVGKKKYRGSMEYLIGGPAFFTDFLNEIEKSNDEIFIRLYIYSNDDYGVRLSNVLKNKDGDGVDVRILTGGLANNVESMKRSEIPFDSDFKQPKSIGQYLAYKSNINFRTSADTFFMFDHSKMIIVDKKTAYVGGMNIGQPYRYTWHDMMIKLKGPIVHEVRNQFKQAWAAAGPTGDLGKFSTTLINLKGPSKKLKKHYDIDKENQADIRILYTKPQKKTVYEAQLEAIKSAKKFIYIQNPYLADYKIINALIDARGRGVDVRVILPSKNNVGMMASSNLVTTNIFLKNGIRVFKYQGMTHIKAAIYDGWATLGSANFDNLSLMMNDEFNIGFSNPYYVNKLKKELFDVDFGLSTEVTKPYVINWHDKVMSAFANRF